MKKKKKSFFQKLAQGISGKSDDYLGSDVIIDDDGDVIVEDDDVEDVVSDEVGELSVDMYRVDNTIIVKAMIAGIQKSEMDISLSRDRITIAGSRYDISELEPDEVYFKELYWGKFERTIELPDEVDVDIAEAHESHGLLTLVLPIIDKERKTTLKVQ